VTSFQKASLGPRTYDTPEIFFSYQNGWTMHHPLVFFFFFFEKKKLITRRLQPESDHH